MYLIKLVEKATHAAYSKWVEGTYLGDTMKQIVYLDPYQITVDLDRRVVSPRFPANGPFVCPG